METPITTRGFHDLFFWYGFEFGAIGMLLMHPIIFSFFPLPFPLLSTDRLFPGLAVMAEL